MRIHTYGLMNMVTVGAYVQYKKEKLSTNSSTEADIFGVGDVLTQVIWFWYFLKEKGCEIRDNFFYQYNHSIIKLENNGRRSNSKIKIHTNIIYYFITGIITKKGSSLGFFPTLDMIRDYFTKALQGYQFCRFCDIILGIHEDDISSCNISGRAFLEDQNIKLGKDKEEA